MPRYEKAPAEVRLVLQSMLEKYHPPLVDACVTFDLLMAFPLTDENGDSKGPALKHAGYPALATIKAIGLKERTSGRPDVEILIDGESWPLLSDAEKDALIDHELEHLDLKLDKDGLVVRDDLSRPKFVMRKHDHQFGWFDSIARRHGIASQEVQQFRRFQEDVWEQQWLPFLGPSSEAA